MTVSRTKMCKNTAGSLSGGSSYSASGAITIRRKYSSFPRNTVQISHRTDSTLAKTLKPCTL